MRRLDEKRAFSRSNLIGVAFTAIVFILANKPKLCAAETLTPEQAKTIFETIEPAIVQLTVRGRRDGSFKPTIYGTGFAVQTPRGARIITAGHVIGKDIEWDDVAGRPDRDIWIRTVVNFGTQTLDPVNDAASHSEYDLAQIFVRPGATYLGLTDNPVSPGDQVLVVSWRFDPNAIRQTPAKWRIATVLDPEENLMRLSGDFQVSESGSPVFNHDGGVIGVLVERRVDQSGSAVRSQICATWVKDYQRPEDVFFHHKTKDVAFWSNEKQVTKLNLPQPPARTEKTAELKARCVFLGKRSALSTGKAGDMPFGRELLDKISVKARRDDMAGTILTTGTNVNIRSACPLVQSDGTAFYGSIVGTLHPRESALIKSIEALTYLDDTYYWALVDKVADN